MPPATPAKTKQPRPRAAAAPMIRTSERKDWKRCPQKWWWSYREGLVMPGHQPNALWFGIGIHLSLAGWYTGPGLKRGVHPAETFENWIGNEVRTIRTNMKGDASKFDEDEYVSAKALGIGMLNNYVTQYGRDEFMHVIQPEHPFQIEIPPLTGTRPLVIYCGTYDLVFIDLLLDTVWLGEHKSYKAIQTNHLALDDQCGSYWMAANAHLRDDKRLKGQPLEGIMYNILRKALPDDRPKDAEGYSLNKDGSRSKQQQAALFHREAVYRTKREMRTQIERIQSEATVMALHRSGKLPLWKTPTRDCTFDCQFKDMCELHEGGADWQEYRDAVYIQVDPYAAHRKSAAE